MRRPKSKPKRLGDILYAAFSPTMKRRILTQILRDLGRHTVGELSEQLGWPFDEVQRLLSDLSDEQIIMLDESLRDDDGMLRDDVRDVGAEIQPFRK